MTVPTPEEAATVVYTAVDGVYSGYLLISDEVKEDAKEAISRLHHVGVKKTVMLTGDIDRVARKAAEETGVILMKCTPICFRQIR